jgi:hypothetical protein
MSALKTHEYIQNGLANNDCKTVPEWLHYLADTYGVSYAIVEQSAFALGPSELFDGLVSSIQDLA